MTPDNVFAFLYPSICSWMKTGMQAHVTRDRVIEPFMKFGNATRQQALEAFSYGSLPKVKSFSVDGYGDIPGNEKGWTAPGTEIIWIREDLCKKAEEKLAGGADRPARQFEITLLHELVHWSHHEHGMPTNARGKELRGEMGRRFERRVYRLP